MSRRQGPVGSHRSGSRSENGSVVGSVTPSCSGAKSFVVKPVEKKEGDWDKAITEALKGGGNYSACSRGGPLRERLCQVCKDVAEKCKDGIRCRCIASKISGHLLLEYPKECEDKEMCEAVFRFVKELAEKHDHLRAKQVMASDLLPGAARADGTVDKPEGRQCILFFVKKHREIVEKVKFCNQKLMESKTPQQVETEIPAFLDSIKASKDKEDVAHLVDLFKLIEEFQPFLQQTHDEAAEMAAEAAKAAVANGEKVKTIKSMHGDSDIVDKFFLSRKTKGDRAFMKSILVMSCDQKNDAKG